ncbi:TonB-dependent receptor, partial [Porticoccaceae bacterium]|nr:TonB-dependent receptor [Porticoccaceae bacterium]
GEKVTQHNQRERINMNSKTIAKKTLLATVIGVFAAGGMGTASAQDQVSEGATAQSGIDEIIVTANKRETNLQDTAMSLSVLTEETITNRGLVSASDYLAAIPGVSYGEQGVTNNKIVIRGLANGNVTTDSSVGTYLGEIPLGTGIFDLKLVDIERVELLKGPQGTLYGSDAFSGVIRNVPVAPNLQEMQGNIKVDISSQSESDDYNNSVVAAFNIPLVTDQLALRVAAYRFDNAGYVDAVSSPLVESVAATTGSTVIIEDDIGGSTFTGVRAALLWAVNENLDVTFTLGTQEIDVEGSSVVRPDELGYEVNYLNVEHGLVENVDFDYSNILIEYDLGWASLMSATSLFNGTDSLNQNFFTESPEDNLGPVSLERNRETDRFVEEIRLNSKLDGPWQFLIGFFYEDLQLGDSLRNPWGGSVPYSTFGLTDLTNPILSHTEQETDLEQKALFGEVSYAFNPQWEITVGGRYFDYESEDVVQDNLSVFNPVLNVTSVDASETGSIFKTNLSYRPNSDSLYYVQWSEGFRLGRGQTLPPANLCDTDSNGKLDFTDGDLVSQVDSDRTENFEIGAKFSLLDSRLTLNTAFFTIDWMDLPSQIINTNSTDTGGTCPSTISITNNIGEASSKGVEIEANYLVTQQLAINLSASYIEAEWEDTTGITAEPGESLSLSPNTNASLSVQYDFDLTEYPAFVRTDVSYVGEYENSFQADNYGTAGDYVNVKLRLGVNVENWSFALYGDNLTNDKGLILNSPFSKYGQAPRKIGFQTSYAF